MNDTAIRFAFSIGDRVQIAETRHPAMVTGLLHEQSGNQVRVVWWNNGERKDAWLFEGELCDGQPHGA